MLKKKDLKYFPQIPVVGLIVIYLITLSFYAPFWFRRTLRAVNRISSRPKISEKWFVALLVLQIFFAVGELVSKINSQLFTILYIIGGICGVAGSFILLIFCIIFKDRIEDASKEYIHFNLVLLFFFYIFYMQYKINRIPTEKKKKNKTEEQETGS